jgi:hypothetical protein
MQGVVSTSFSDQSQQQGLFENCFLYRNKTGLLFSGYVQQRPMMSQPTYGSQVQHPQRPSPSQSRLTSSSSSYVQAAV